MLDEIQALLPLLENVADGALWAFLIYMVVKVIGIVTVPIVVAVIFIRITPSVIVGLRGHPPAEKRTIDLHSIELEGDTVCKFLGTKEKFSEFISWAANENSGYGRYLHDSNLDGVMRGEVAAIK